MNRLRDMDTGFGVHVYRKPDLALVLGETGQRLDRTLSSLVAANVLVRAARGVYASPGRRISGRRRCIPSHAGCAPDSWCGRAWRAR